MDGIEVAFLRWKFRRVYRRENCRQLFLLWNWCHWSRTTIPLFRMRTLILLRNADVRCGEGFRRFDLCCSPFGSSKRLPPIETADFAALRLVGSSAAIADN